MIAQQAQLQMNLHLVLGTRERDWEQKGNKRTSSLSLSLSTRFKLHSVEKLKKKPAVSLGLGFQVSYGSYEALSRG
jgi:hypothetical protein